MDTAATRLEILRIVDRCSESPQDTVARAQAYLDFVKEAPDGKLSAEDVEEAHAYVVFAEALRTRRAHQGERTNPSA